jgi:thioester reductase-like protein
MTTNLNADVALPDDIRPAPLSEYPQNPGKVFLTGATGFLGAYVLAELLAQTRAEVHCLVRADDEAAAMQRLRDTLAHYGLTGDLSRVKVAVGRLDAPRLGLIDDVYERLAAEMEIIYHVAADVNFLPNYDRIKTVNVDGTCQLIRLACEMRAKPLHAVSTYSVFNASNYAGLQRATEAPLTGEGAGFRRGYPASKWVAERLGDVARERGLNVTNYRAGLLSGDTRSGRFKDDDVMALNIVASRALGIAQDIDFLLHLTPVDYCARALVAISLKPNFVNRCHHLVTDKPLAWRDLIAWMNRNGNAVKLVSPVEWFAQFKTHIRARPTWGPLFWLLSHDPRRSFWNDANIFSMHFDTSNVSAALAGSGIVCPPPDDRLLSTYLDYLTARHT